MVCISVEEQDRVGLVGLNFTLNVEHYEISEPQQYLLLCERNKLWNYVGTGRMSGWGIESKGTP